MAAGFSCAGVMRMKSAPSSTIGTELPQLGRHRRDAVGFLDPPRRDVAQRRRAPGEQRRRGQRHRRIGNVVAIEVDRDQAAFRRPRFHPVRPHLDAGAHLRQRLGKLHVALDRIAPDTLDAHRAAANRPERQKVGSRRGIALDINRPRRHVAATCLDRKSLPAFALDHYAEARHGRQRDFDIGPGNQLADDVNRNRLASERQRHQQAGEELARDVAAYPHRATGANGSGLEMEGRVTRVAEIGDVRPQLAQTIDQIADRPLVHARHALQHVVATSERQRRGQRTKRRAGIAEEKLRLAHREFSAATGNAPAFPTQGCNADAKRPQGIEHALGIIRSQQVAHLGFTFGQRGKQQDAVGNAFRAGQANRSGGGNQLGKIEEFVSHTVTVVNARPSPQTLFRNRLMPGSIPEPGASGPREPAHRPGKDRQARGANSARNHRQPRAPGQCAILDAGSVGFARHPPAVPHTASRRDASR